MLVVGVNEGSFQAATLWSRRSGGNARCLESTTDSACDGQLRRRSSCFNQVSGGVCDDGLAAPHQPVKLGELLAVFLDGEIRNPPDTLAKVHTTAPTS